MFGIIKWFWQVSFLLNFKNYKLNFDKKKEPKLLWWLLFFQINKQQNCFEDNQGNLDDCLSIEFELKKWYYLLEQKKI